MWAVFIAMGILWVLSLLFLSGKGAFYFLNIHHLSDEESESHSRWVDRMIERYDEASLSRFLGKICLALALSLVLWAFGMWLSNRAVFYAGAAVSAGIAAFAFLYIRFGNHFTKE